MGSFLCFVPLLSLLLFVFRRRRDLCCTRFALRPKHYVYFAVLLCVYIDVAIRICLLGPNAHLLLLHVISLDT